MVVKLLAALLVVLDKSLQVLLFTCSQVGPLSFAENDAFGLAALQFLDLRLLLGQRNKLLGRFFRIHLVGTSNCVRFSEAQTTMSGDSLVFTLQFDHPFFESAL